MWGTAPTASGGRGELPPGIERGGEGECRRGGVARGDEEAGGTGVRPNAKQPLGQTRYATGVRQGNWFSVAIGPVPTATQ